MSAFMNNVGALSLLMPAVIESARKAKLPVGRVLMPLSFGSILGGLITLIGTPPNIIVATYRGQTTGMPFSMFDFSLVGLPVALLGVIFIALIGWRLMPLRNKDTEVGELFDIHNYVTEVLVPEGCPSLGKSLVEIDQETEDLDVVLIDLVRRERHYLAPWQKQLQAGDIVLIEGGPKDIDAFVRRLGLELRGDGEDNRPATDEEPRRPLDEQSLMEVVILPRSRLVGRTVGTARWLWRGGVALLGVSRQGTPYRGRLSSFRIEQGDVLLLSGEPEDLAGTVTTIGALPLAGRDIAFRPRRRVLPVVAIFALAIAASSFGLLPIWISLGIAVTLYVVFGFLPARDLYDGVDWPVVVLLGSLVPIGEALQSSGATDVISQNVLMATHGFPIWVVLTLLLVVTMTLSDLLNNAATAVVMAPIALGIAQQLGVSADPFLMAVALGASCAFLTPIGHQNNALIMGPGGYRFGDYWRMGLPLEILIVAAGVPLILIAWPL